MSVYLMNLTAQKPMGRFETAFDAIAEALFECPSDRVFIDGFDNVLQNHVTATGLPNELWDLVPLDPYIEFA